jgi:hypothetical protein
MPQRKKDESSRRQREIGYAQSIAAAAPQEDRSRYTGPEPEKGQGGLEGSPEPADGYGEKKEKKGGIAAAFFTPYEAQHY